MIICNDHAVWLGHIKAMLLVLISLNFEWTIWPCLKKNPIERKWLYDSLAIHDCKRLYLVATGLNS